MAKTGICKGGCTAEDSKKPTKSKNPLPVVTTKMKDNIKRLVMQKAIGNNKPVVQKAPGNNIPMVLDGNESKERNVALCIASLETQVIHLNPLFIHNVSFDIFPLTPMLDMRLE